MFRSIVSRLSFSPALVGQLSFYARRLRKEQTTRRLGLVFVALALVVQSLAVFQPPEAANASNSSDFVPGGLGLGANKSLNNFLRPYDANANNLHDIMDSVGITRAEIASAQFGKWRTPGKISYGRDPRAGQVGSVTVYNDNWDVVGAIYGRPMTYANGNTDIYGWIGYSSRVGWFAIMQACGNLVTDYVPPSLTPPTPPAPAPGKLELSKTALNTTQGNIDATKQEAKADDRITYTITVKNTGGDAMKASFEDHLGDVLEYTSLIDRGGGSFDVEKQILSWPEITLDPGKSESRSYTVKFLSKIPATPKGQSDPSSYDCRIENVFGNGVVVPVSCETPKVIEKVVEELPKTGPTENMVFAAIVLAIVTYFYFRSRQLNKEVRLIRRDLNAGTL